MLKEACGEASAKMLSVFGEFLLGLLAIVILLTIGRHHPEFARKLATLLLVIMAVNYCILRIRYEGLRSRFFKINKLEKKRKALLVPPKS